MAMIGPRMDLTPYQTFQVIVVLVMATIWALSTVARRRPDIGWLQPFRAAFPRMTEQQRARAKRRADFYTGFEFILLGIVIPMGYVALTVMMFNSFTVTGIIVTAATSIICIGLGVTVIVRSRRPASRR
jgi:hypothetical protein